MTYTGRMEYCCRQLCLPPCYRINIFYIRFVLFVTMGAVSILCSYVKMYYRRRIHKELFGRLFNIEKCLLRLSVFYLVLKRSVRDKEACQNWIYLVYDRRLQLKSSFFVVVSIKMYYFIMLGDWLFA